MIVNRCRTCEDTIRTDKPKDLSEYLEVWLPDPCDFCKLVIKETSEDKLLRAIFGEEDAVQ